MPHVLHRHLSLSALAHGPDAGAGGRGVGLCLHLAGPGEKGAARHGGEPARTIRLPGGSQPRRGSHRIQCSRAVLVHRLPLVRANHPLTGVALRHGAGGAG